MKKVITVILGIIYLISAIGISLLLPLLVLCSFIYIVYLQEKVKKLEGEQGNN